MHPFTGLATQENGAVMACCRSHPVGFIQDASLEEIWNNDTMKRIRMQVLNDERPPECEPCFNLEDQGVESLRQRHTAGFIPEARINLYPDALNALNDDYTMPFEIPTMEIKLNNLCNLKCRMCHPVDSTSWNDWDQVEEFYKTEGNIIAKLVDEHDLKRKPYLDKFEDNPNWWDSFEKLLPYFRRVEFAGGEPLMDPQHYRILDMLSQYGENIEIKYATNLTTLGIKGGRSVHNYWPKFKSVAVNISIDGVGEVYEHIRGNASWDELVANIQEIKKFDNISRIVGACTVQVGNVMQLDKIAEVFLNELEIIFHTHRVSYPNLLSAQVLPQELKDEATRRLEALKPKLKDFSLAKKIPEVEQYAQGQLQDNINFINAKDWNHLWEQTVEFNHRLDKSRDQKSFEEVVPEYKDYV
jgi:MoaA/NifB/PqqE/SkfB family radical SAM enzyme